MSRDIVKLSTGACVQFSPGVGEGLLPAVLLVHGWKSEPFHKGGTYNLASKSLNELGYHTLLLCLQGHGRAAGDINTVTPLDNSRDIMEGFYYLREQPGVDESRMGAFAASYGAYLLAALLPVLPGLKLLALRAPALYPDVLKDAWELPTIQAVADPELGPWRSQEHTRQESDALEGISKFAGDVLIVASELDEDMPPAVAHSYRLAAIGGRAITVEVSILPGAGHTLQGEHREKFLEILSQWFRQYYPTAQS